MDRSHAPHAYRRLTWSWFLDSAGLGTVAAFLVAVTSLLVERPAPPASQTSLGTHLLFDALPWLFALLVLWAVATLYTRRVRTVWLDGQGVVLEHVLGKARRLPWFVVREAVCDGLATVRLTTETGRVTLRFMERAPQLVDRIAAELSQRHAVAEASEPVDRELLAQWLGVSSDGSLTVSPGRWLPLALGALLWGVLTAVLAVTWSDVWTVTNDPGSHPFSEDLAALAVFALVYLIYFPLHLAMRLRSDALRRVVATPDVLRWRDGGRWHEARWHEVSDVALVPRQGRRWTFYFNPQDEEADREVRVTCGLRNLRFHPDDHRADRLRQALDQLLAARRAGRSLPPAQVIPNTALSRAEPAEAAAERGISRV